MRRFFHLASDITGSAGPGPVRWKPPNEGREHYSTLTASMMFSLAPAGVDLKNQLHRAGFLSWPPAVVRSGSAAVSTTASISQHNQRCDLQFHNRINTANS